MKTRLSHSAVSKYISCGEMYRLHYIEKLRPVEMKSSLLFGAAFDVALNAMLEGNTDFHNIFDQAFTYATINGKEIFIPTSTDVEYAKADIDLELLEESDHTSKYTQGFLSLSRKGHIMLRDYATKVLPKLKVISIQETINLTNTEGDVITGIVDLVAEVDGEVVILDNKTSARPYKKDSVVSSEQLSLYTHALEDKYNTRRAGFIVINKNIKKNRTKICQTCGHDGSGKRHETCPNIVDEKRCNGTWTETISPEADIQIIIDTINDEVENAVIENMDTVNENIKAGHFPKNPETCKNFYGRPCPYYNLCYYDNADGLVDHKKPIDKPT